MAPKTEKTTKDEFLQTHSSVRPYGRGELDKLFGDMKGEIKKDIIPGKFYDAAMSIGTHAPKLVNGRSKMKAVMIGAGNGNRPGRIAASGNANSGKYMKVLLRPILVIGVEGEDCLFNYALRGDAIAKDLLKAFGKVFGAECLKELEEGLKDRKKPIEVSVRSENVPIFFAPDGKGGSIQLTPAGSIEAHANMGDLKWRFREEAKRIRLENSANQANKNGAPKEVPVYGNWSELSFSDKAHNMIIGAPRMRTRFQAEFPKVLEKADAEIWRFRNGGSFPRFESEDVLTSLVSYARECLRLDDPREFRGGNVLKAHQGRAEFIAKAMRDFIVLVGDEANEGRAAETRLELPAIVAVALAAPIAKYVAIAKEQDRNFPEALNAVAIRQFIQAPHFRAVAEKFEDYLQ